MTNRPTYNDLLQAIEKLKKEALNNETAVDQLSTIFDLSLDMIGSGNLQGYFTKINPSFKRILGYQEEEFCSSPFLELVHPDDVEDTRKAIERAADGQQTISIENRYSCKDGAYKWIDWRVQAFANENLFIAVGRDITDRKSQENELRLNERRYRNIIQTSNDGFILTDQHGKIIDCNSAYITMSGYTRDELLGLGIADVEASENQEETALHIRDIMSAGWAFFESKHRRKDGSPFDVEVSTTFLEHENIFVAFIKDITAKNRILAAKTESEERFRQLAENIDEVFWLGSLDWQEVYYISPAYEKVWGKPCDSLYRDPLSWLDSVLKEDLEKVQNAIPKTLDDKTKSFAFPDYRIHDSGGNIHWIRARAFPFRNSEGKLYRIAGVAADVTHEKQDKLEKEKLVTELQTALEQVNTLSGFLPVCSSCKKIRDEEGHWEHIESYIAKHSEAEFTHSLCPVCALKLYPEYVDFDKQKKTKE